METEQAFTPTQINTALNGVDRLNILNTHQMNGISVFANP